MDSAERRSLLALLGPLSLLVAVAAFAVGCGETVIDSSKMEDTLRHSLESERKEDVSSVECPSGQKVEAKATFECTVHLAEGKTKTATIEIRNEKADVSVIGLEEGRGADE